MRARSPKCSPPLRGGRRAVFESRAVLCYYCAEVMEAKYHKELAERYRTLRTTDTEPVDFVCGLLPPDGKITVADMGCGAGRYARLFFDNLGGRLFLHCFDTNEYMLDQLKPYLADGGAANFSAKIADARDTPLSDGSVDAVLCFNSVHHIGLFGFLREASRILKLGGAAFVYTRSREQNDRTVWGKQFPLFRRKESRLYEPEEFEFKVRRFPEFRIETVKTFIYERVHTPAELEEKAAARAYSPFLLYGPEEFSRAFEEFRENLKTTSGEKIEWEDGRMMYVIRKG